MSEAHLIIGAGRGAGTVWVIPDGELRTVGSHPQAQLRLPELDYRHAVVRYCDMFEVQAIEGVETTRIAGRVGRAGEWRSLRPGDELVLGPYVFQLQLVGLSAETMVLSAATKRLAPQLFPPGYTIRGRLGGGAFGAVYNAVRDADRQEVALKVLKHVPDDKTLARFSREFEAALALDHPNIVKVLEQGVEQFPPFVAMELIPGSNAGSLAMVGKLPIERALRIALGVAEALTHLEAQGMVHRDIKPANIMVGEDDVAKLADFGLVKDTDDVVTALTKTGSGMGTMAYAAPEQIKDAKRVSPRADIYSLGATLFHLIGGRAPFSISTVGELKKVFQETPADLTQVRGDCPRPVQELVASMLAKAPEDRPSASEVAATLRELLG